MKIEKVIILNPELGFEKSYDVEKAYNLPFSNFVGNRIQLLDNENKIAAKGKKAIEDKQTGYNIYHKQRILTYLPKFNNALRNFIYFIEKYPDESFFLKQSDAEWKETAILHRTGRI